MKSMFAMVSLGVGEMMGGLLIGQVIDKFGNRAAVCTNVILVVL